MTLRIGILTVSDRASAGEMEDRGGPAVEDALAPLGCRAMRAIVSDDRDRIEQALRRWCDEDVVDVILTTGGTGLGPRDVTPDVTAELCDRLVPGIAEAMRTAGMQTTRRAMLSRAVAGIRGRTLIINLPGTPRGAREGVEVLLPVLQHAVDTLAGAHHG